MGRKPKPTPGTGRVRFKETYGKYVRGEIATIPLGEIEIELENKSEKKQRFEVLLKGDAIKPQLDEANRSDLPIG